MAMIEVALLSGHRAIVSMETGGEELTVAQLRHRAQLALGVGIKARPVEVVHTLVRDVVGYAPELPSILWIAFCIESMAFWVC